MSVTAKGYTVRGNTGLLIDSLRSRTALVCGSAKTVFRDFQNAYDIGRVVFAVNDCGMYLPVVHHWVSCHGDKLKAWEAVRQCDYPTKSWVEHTNWSLYGCQYAWELEPAFSLSGLVAAQIAYLMGCERIILCGCPGDGTPRFFEAGPRADYSYGNGETSADQRDREQLLKEMKRVPGLKAAIRSMSGWSKTYFGGIDGDRSEGMGSIGNHDLFGV